jgi:hypothetical protein
LPQFAFGGILPTRRNLHTTSELPSQQVMRKQIQHYFAKLRAQIERQLRTRIKGIFLRSNDSVPNLPAVEMLSIAGLSADSGKDLLEQLRGNLGWSGSFGFFDLPGQVFHGSDCLFQFPDFFHDQRNGGTRPYRLISIRKAENEVNSDGSKRQTFESQDVANSLTCLLSLFGLLETTRHKVQTLRMSVYRTLGGKQPIKRLRREIRLNDDMQLHRMILRRLQFEITESKQTLELEVRELNSFASVRDVQTNGLGSHMLRVIEVQLKQVCGHTEIVSREISDYLQRRNLDLTFRLQKRLFLWSTVLGVLTVVTSTIAAFAVTKDWPSLQHFVTFLHRLITRHL